ncbi:hypothetical protein R52603_05638 [Paraburkholderia saeva]|uniref:Condensation domain-containing protein n=1 Tax=Paraburkholderia saeva TaxID=2777537 RepID=A0A9N8X3R3_9BURK|nr:hypothetical protein LMG31841_05263 [Paraburkholderia saeva]CAG4927949.1 hypothetical protein R52603_05638 [Paraburkholderia saeva]CAG4928201.1 hypothetical protein R70241_05691 [Paraburkholderia saeva]
MRRLGALEQLYWFYDRATPFHFVMAAEVEGQTQADAWRNALDRLQQRHPLFRASIRQGPERTYTSSLMTQHGFRSESSQMRTF